MLFSAPTKGLAWDSPTHTYIAEAAGAKIPKLATMPDVFRGTDEHYINFKIATRSIDEYAKEVDRYLEFLNRDSGHALHGIADATMPFRMLEYNEFNKLNHLKIDTIIGKLSDEEFATLKAVPATTGDLKENVKKAMMSSFEIAKDISAGKYEMTRELALERIKLATALSKQYLAEHPEPAKFKLNTKADIITRQKENELLSKYAATLTDTEIEWAGKEKWKTDLDRARKASIAIQEAAISESNQLTEYIQRKGGPARSIYQIEPRSAEDIIRNAGKRRMEALSQASGIPARQLKKMTRDALRKELEQNDLFGAVLARYHFARDKAPLSDDLNVRAKSYADYYWAGEGSENRVKKARKYIEDNERFAANLRKAQSAKVPQKNDILNISREVFKAHRDKIGSKSGNASTKAAQIVNKTVRKAMKRVVG